MKINHDNEALVSASTSASEKNRRKILSMPFLLGMVSSSLARPPSPANAAQTAGEAVRRSAANIPGYGQPDVFYPASFAGKWRATRVIVSSLSAEISDPIMSKVLASVPLPLTLFYDVRFITVDGDDNVNTNANSNEKVIADRQFNEASYFNALKEAVEQSQSQQKVSMPSIQTIVWSPFNPNVCTINYNDSSMKEIKVTKRAAELDMATGSISSSEYRRITNVSSTGTGNLPGGIPNISASRVLTKWKVNDTMSNSAGDESGKQKQSVEGLEVVYSDGAMGGDPMSMGIGSGGGGGAKQPQMISKSRLRLQKLD
uniref:DUF6816 domain-containing protein n=1 Tax=Chaetoceros debilis TaxID=122233 RepID=A0A7S3PYA0_9STRA